MGSSAREVGRLEAVDRVGGAWVLCVVADPAVPGPPRVVTEDGREARSIGPGLYHVWATGEVLIVPGRAV